MDQIILSLQRNYSLFKEKFFLICMDKLTKIKKYSTASASEQLICEETQREFNQ